MANLRKIEFNIDIYNREENRLEVQMRIHQEKKNMMYEKEIEELKKNIQHKRKSKKHRS